MGLASALSTALTGLTAAETTIDVVGNNLANSSTVGFKSSSASFSTQFLQTLSLGAGPTNMTGGSNPRQLGLGAMVADVTPNFNQGTIEISSNPTDLAIQGEGFFVVQSKTGEHLYTRNGVFKVNAENQIVTITGNRVLGFGVDDQFQVQRTALEALTVPLGTAAVAKSTDNVLFEGTLSPTGDVADTAEKIQTNILGDADPSKYSPPSAAATTALSTVPNLAGAGTAGISQLGGGGALTPGVYQYRFVFADEAYNPTGVTNEGVPSATLTVTLGGGDDQIRLNDVPQSTQPYSHIRIYRTESDGSDFYYLDEIEVATAADPTTYLDDTVDDATLATRAGLNTDTLSGNYSYYVTFASATGGAGVGVESRPNPLSVPINVVNGRIQLTNLPVDSSGQWVARRIYRNLSTDTSTFHYIGEIADVTSNVTITDNLTDLTISTRPTIDLDGPRITANTELVDVLRRDGSSYINVFQEGTLDLTGYKGGRQLTPKELTITSTTTVLELIDFMEEALGIQKPPGNDPANPVPLDSSGDSPGGTVTSDGRIVLTGNNGVDNAIKIGLSGMQLTTSASSGNIDLPWGSTQTAVGESAVTDFLVYDSLGVPLRVRVTAVLQSRDSSSTTYRWFADSPDNDPASGVEIGVGTGLLTFDGSGNLISATSPTVSIDRRNVSSVSPLEFDLDFSQLSGLAVDDSNLAVSRQDGSAPGELTSFMISEDGSVQGVFTNGVTRDLGQIRLVRFANPTGLEQRGENLFAEGANSGLPVEGDPGEQGIGSILAGAIELSNTDVGANLIDLILASTMYRGNARVITTAQQMIDELLALRR